MTDEQWQVFYRICAQELGVGRGASESRSWCAWTTSRSLGELVHYWAAGIPPEQELGDSGVRDGGPWGQPSLYGDLAHIIIPAEF